MIGKQILNYEIKSLIGEGGMGNVYLAEHTSIGRQVAVKALRPELAKNEEIRKRFMNEAKVMAQLQHPNIVSLYDYHEDGEGLYLIMEYVKGIELKELLHSLTEPLSIERATNLMKKILSAFDYAHKNGIVHRDVKPSNILITSDDGVKILDFGIAKLIGDADMNLTKTGAKVGTVYYMSPEQVKAQELDSRSDIYSLGVTFYELLAGYCPYTSMNSEYEVYDKIVREPLVSLTESMGEEYAGAWAAIEKATEKKPEDRFQDCAEFVKAISSGKIEKKATVRTEPKPESPKENVVAPDTQQAPKKKSRTFLYIGIAAAVIAIGALLYVFVIMPANNASTENVADEDGTFVIVKSLNVRASSSVSSQSIDQINLGQKVELIGSPVGPVTEEESLITWQQISYNGNKGWIAIEIDGQSTLGSSEDLKALNAIFGGDFAEDHEFHSMDRWAINAAIEFLNDQGKTDYTFLKNNEYDLKSGYHSMIAYHSNPYANKKDPLEFVALLGNPSGEKMLIFFKPYEDKPGGRQTGYVPVPKSVRFIRYDNDDYDTKFSLYNASGRIVGRVDDTYYQFEAGEPEPDNWLSSDEVESQMSYYYGSIEDGSFDAYEHYAYQVDQYISKKNLTPSDINTLREKNNEYLNQRINYMYNVRFDRVENKVSYWTYWIDFQCFRRSMSRIQKCQTQVEVGFNQDYEIVSYREISVKDLTYE